MAASPIKFGSAKAHLGIGSIIIYLDDILIFSNNIEDHHHVVREVFQRLNNHGLYIKVSKCEFIIRTFLIS